MIQGIIRRRMFGVEDKNKYAFTRYATKYTPANPKVMDVLYSNNLCASPDYMTIEEAKVLTSNNLKVLKGHGYYNEPFDGFQYCTTAGPQYTNFGNNFSSCGFTHVIFPNNIKGFPEDMFRQNKLEGIIRIPASVKSTNARCFYQMYNENPLYAIIEGLEPFSTYQSAWADVNKIYVDPTKVDVFKSQWSWGADRIDSIENLNL